MRLARSGDHEVRKVIDIEASGLLDETAIDYLASPFKLKPTFNIWCLVMRDIDNHLLVHSFVGIEEIKLWAEEHLPTITTLVAHNGIDYDFLVLKLLRILDYEIAWKTGELSIVNGRKVNVVDTLVVSKALNPDRLGGHSLDEWGKRVGQHKIDWRQRAIELELITANDPKGAEFQKWHPEMLTYCQQDTLVNVLAFLKMEEEAGDWNWNDAFWLELKVRDIISRQSHRGFWFNKQLAEENVRDLDQKMEEIRKIVEPLLPPKPMGVTKLKQYMPPKIQFKKNGEVSVPMQKWAEKHGAILYQEEAEWQIEIYGQNLRLPLNPETPVKKFEPATLKDTTHIKGWLVELGWRPTQYKERDLTVDAKKQKLSPEKFEAAVRRYVEQTLESPFCRDRLSELDTTKKQILTYLLGWEIRRPLKVPTNPTITVGMDKEIDPALLELGDKFPHAKLVSEYLTYDHRRNAILGGGVDPDEWDEDDDTVGKGFLSAGRLAVDNRIPTPADSCGASTSRMKHRVVANIPRITSLYGDRMRGMFGTDVKAGMYQMGYDFASLEAMMESHYCQKYDDEGLPYCNSLVQEKPNDVHTITAKRIEQMIGQPFSRTQAKPVKYACAYGAQPKRVAKTVGCSEELGAKIHGAYWDAAKPLARLGERLKEYWTKTGQKKFILGLDGRKVPTRSASALINSLFQSAGVICAKRAMVLHEQKLKEAGLYVDFFKDDWQNKVFAQQLIAYHDEAQMELHKSLIKWNFIPIKGPWEVEVDGKMKPSPEVEAAEATLKAFKENNPGWSEIGHSDKGCYIGFCLPGVLIQEAVRETSAYYKLNVTLAADYILGRNWGECH